MTGGGAVRAQVDRGANEDAPGQGGPHRGAERGEGESQPEGGRAGGAGPGPSFIPAAERQRCGGVLLPSVSTPPPPPNGLGVCRRSVCQASLHPSTKPSANTFYQLVIPHLYTECVKLSSSTTHASVLTLLNSCGHSFCPTTIPEGGGGSQSCMCDIP